MTKIMKKILFAVLMLTALLFTSCDNDDIEIVYEQTNHVTVSLTDFTSCYEHSAYGVFNSSYGRSIVVRVLFYNSNGQLVDSIRTYSTDLKPVKKDIRLASGKYTAVATLTFADKKYNEYWILTNKEDLSTVYLETPYIPSLWSIISYASQEFSIESGKTTELQLTPKPVGSSVTLYYNNFQYSSKTNMNNGKVSDSGVRWIGLLTQNFANGYKLNPKASERYIYAPTSTGNNWWYLDSNEPDDYNWTTYFRDDMYSTSYILAPECKLCFGYQMEGESGFSPVGEAKYTIENGKNYYGIWDWINGQGNPYFGLRSNNSPMHTLSNAKQFLEERTKIGFIEIPQYREK